jgi:hypothetical protein
MQYVGEFHVYVRWYSHFYLNNYIGYIKIIIEPGSSVSILTGYGLEGSGSITDKDRFFPLPSASRLALGPTQPPKQWVEGVLSPELKCGRSLLLTTHLLLVLSQERVELYLLSP